MSSASFKNFNPIKKNSYEKNVHEFKKIFFFLSERSMNFIITFFKINFNQIT